MATGWQTDRPMHPVCTKNIQRLRVARDIFNCGPPVRMKCVGHDEHPRRGQVGLYHHMLSLIDHDATSVDCRQWTGSRSSRCGNGGLPLSLDDNPSEEIGDLGARSGDLVG